MTPTYDDPNRESVGLAPIWTGADGGTAFDPGAHTIADVEAYVADHPGERDAVAAAERAGKNRVTLIGALEDSDDEND